MVSGVPIDTQALQELLGDDDPAQIREILNASFESLQEITGEIRSGHMERSAVIIIFQYLSSET